jgi:hypothetical protein
MRRIRHLARYFFERNLTHPTTVRQHCCPGCGPTGPSGTDGRPTQALTCEPPAPRGSRPEPGRAPSSLGTAVPARSLLEAVGHKACYRPQAH